MLSTMLDISFFMCYTKHSYKKQHKIKEINSKMNNNKEIKDHKGRIFSDKKTMCKYYGIYPKLLRSRLRIGWSLEESLDPTGHFDHAGENFRTIGEMCEYHGVAQSTFYQRLAKGATLEEALYKKQYVDHLNNTFGTKKAMCNYHKVSYELYRYRISQGCSQRQALQPVRRGVS